MTFVLAHIAPLEWGTFRPSSVFPAALARLRI